MENQYFNKAEFLRGIFDSIPSFLFIVDPDVRVFHLNAAASKLMGGPGRSVLLKRGGELLHCIYSAETPEGCGRSQHCRDCVVRNSVGKVFRGESVYRETAKMKLGDGAGVKEISLLITVSPMEYKGKKFAILVMEDVTREKEHEETILQQAAQLEHSNRELEAFSYSVSHDLKTPLRHIDGFSRILLQEYADRLGPQGKDYLQRIYSSSQRMTHLIDDLLDLSRTTGEISREPFDLGPLAEEIAAELSKADPGRQMELVVIPGLVVNADRQLLRIAFNNLLGNSLKFTSERPKARIEVGVTMSNGGKAFFVKDNGAGFDMAYAEKLFAPFERLHDMGRFPGSGIGLATVKRIIERHGGRIWAEGEVEKGATFYFTLQ